MPRFVGLDISQKLTARRRYLRLIQRFGWSDGETSVPMHDFTLGVAVGHRVRQRIVPRKWTKSDLGRP